jgi:hypothetical protein
MQRQRTHSRSCRHSENHRCIHPKSRAMKAGELLTRALVTNFECTGLWVLKKEPKE